jgi:arginyl-tRNA synthetase
MLDGVVEDALRSGVGHEDEAGAVVVDLPGLPSFLLRRSDGGTLYHTRDAATIKYRVETFRPATIVYVVGEPQALYFRQLFALADALGYAPGVELVHRAFGTVFGADGRALSTRRGNMVTLESLLDEAHARTRAVVERGGMDLTEVEREVVAEAVGTGAVIYNDLHQDPRRNLVLDWDRMLALDGDSAAYVQYMHARCRSILRRAEDGDGAGDAAPPSDPAAAELLLHPAEQALVKHIALLPLAARDAAADYSLVSVAAWCHAAARAFAAFYRDCPVLIADDPALRTARLRLVNATAVALANGLRILGIAAPERM